MPVNCTAMPEDSSRSMHLCVLKNPRQSSKINIAIVRAEFATARRLCSACLFSSLFSSWTANELQWGHDDGVVEELWRPAADREPCIRFNGATTMESWKSVADSSTSSPPDRASMGPRQWSRGRG